MSKVLCFVIVDFDDNMRELLKVVFFGLESVWLDVECLRYEFFVDVVV